MIFITAALLLPISTFCCYSFRNKLASSHFTLLIPCILFLLYYFRMEDLKDVVTDIEQLNPTRKTRHHLKTARLICQILHIVDPAEADEYPDVTRAAMKFYVNNSLFSYPRVPHNVLGPSIYSEPSTLTFIMNNCTHMLYYCLKFNSTFFSFSDIFKLLENCNENSLRSVETILTLSARIDKTGALGSHYQLLFCKPLKNVAPFICCTPY